MCNRIPNVFSIWQDMFETFRQRANFWKLASLSLSSVKTWLSFFTNNWHSYFFQAYSSWQARSLADSLPYLKLSPNLSPPHPSYFCDMCSLHQFSNTQIWSLRPSSRPSLSLSKSSPSLSLSTLWFDGWVRSQLGNSVAVLRSFSLGLFPLSKVRKQRRSHKDLNTDWRRSVKRIFLKALSHLTDGGLILLSCSEPKWTAEKFLWIEVRLTRNLEI